MSEKPAEPTMTPRELLALADRLEKSAQAQLERARQIRDAVATIQRLGAMESEDRLSEDAHTALRPAFPGPLHGTPPGSEKTRLTSDADSTTLRDVNANTSSKLARGMSRSRTKRHPFVKALYEKKRITVTEWAKRHGLKPGTVASWTVKPGEGGARRIPREYADKIEQELGVPATMDTWKSGIIEPE